MTQIFATSLATLFVAIGPVEVAAMFLALTTGMTSPHKRRIAIIASVTATIVLVAFALGGVQLLGLIGVGLPAFRTAGGVLLLMVSADLLLAQHSAISSITSTEQQEAHQQQTDIAIFPLAIPLTAGPGSMTAVVLLMGKANTYIDMGMVLGALVVMMALTAISMLAADPLMKILHRTGANVISRVSGVLLAALAMQFIFDGLSQSGLFR
ncbi:MAG TPA: MarC family protein [Rhizomicrobium sp.]|jgi:multiple antibiotic resistance protein|nr:MarC family protein [Rhizomicrobium sp.]